MKPSTRSLRLEFSERYGHHEGEEDIKEARAPGDHSPASSCGSDTIKIPPPAKLKQEESGYYDIELDELPLPIAGTRSTDNLLRIPSVATLRGYPGLGTDPGDDTKAKSNKDFRPNPDYKSVSLRWPYLIFLLALMGGLFAFLEYEIHDLPPMHYSVIEVDLPEPRKVVVPGGAVSLGIPTPSHSEAWPPATKTAQVPTITKPARLARRTAAPDPDPRPPEEDYPNPHSPIFTQCGWKAPTWTVSRFQDPDCDAFTCDDWPQLCSGNRSEVACIRSFLIENIDTFVTDDQSWCPCELYMSGITTWGDGAAVLDPDWMEIGDRGCKSIMLAIQSFNHYKSRELDSKTAVPLDSPEYHRLVSNYDVYMTPPLPETGYWPYPSTKENGDIMMPLVARAAGNEAMDVFGNQASPSDDGLFPDQFQSRAVTGVLEMPVDCWLKKVKHPDHKPTPVCTQTSTGSHSTVWWALPLSRTAVSDKTNLLESSSTTSEPPPQKDDKIRDPTPSSTTPQPVCTSCSSSSQPTGDTRAGKTGTPTSSSSQSIMTEPTLARETGLSTSTTESSRPQGQSSISTGENEDPTTEGLVVVVGSSTSASSYFTLSSAVATSSTESALLFASSSFPSSFSSSSTLPTTMPPPFLVVPIGSPRDSNSTSSPRPPGPILPEAQSVFHNLRSEFDYLMASVIPVLLATLLSIPIQIFTASVSRIIPFRALSYPHGATAKDSLCLSLNSGSNSNNPITPLVLSLRFLHRYRDPVPFLNFALAALSLVLVPLSSEVIRLEFTTECSGRGQTLMTASERICAFGVRKLGALIRVAEGMLAAMAVLVIVLVFLLSKWKSGVATEPWSIASMASLLASARGDKLVALMRGVPKGFDADGRKLRDMDERVEQALKGERFQLGFHSQETGSMTNPPMASYGLQVMSPPTKDDKPIRHTTRGPPRRKPIGKTWKFWKPFLLNSKDTELCLRLLAVLFTLGLLGLILHYETTIAPDTPFEKFMNSESFGVRILFTAFGTIVDAYWCYYFAYVAEGQIHHRLSTPNQPRGHPANTSILMSPPSNVFVGIWRSISLLKSKPPMTGTGTVNSKTNNAEMMEITNMNGFKSKSSTFSSQYSQDSINTATRKIRASHHQDLLTFNVSLATLVSKFTPILFSNIPFSNTVTWRIHEACTWLAVAFLVYMVLVLFASLVLEFRFMFDQLRDRLQERRRGIKTRAGVVLSGGIVDMPVKLDTIAGYIYYLCESRMVEDFEGMLGMGHKERDRLVCEMERRYFFGEMAGSGGGRRARKVGVDYTQ